MDEMMISFPPAVAVQLSHHQAQHATHIPIVGGPALISAANFAATTTTASAASGEGPFYVVMAPGSDVLGHTVSGSRRRALNADNGGGNRTARDEKRRATHNEVGHELVTQERSATNHDHLDLTGRTTSQRQNQ